MVKIKIFEAFVWSIVGALVLASKQGPTKLEYGCILVMLILHILTEIMMIK